jgi:two-component system sensor histidine kinase HydH
LVYDAIESVSQGGPVTNENIDARAAALLDEHQRAVYARTSRMFAVLMLVQWLAAIIVAVAYSPYAWEGKHHAIHAHVWVALFLGGAISSLPVFLAVTRPSAFVTRQVIAVGQMMWSAVLIHLTGGRIETHFHVFGSLAFLALYRDWKVLIPATLVVTTDHLARQMFWPESVFGLLNPGWWRFLEHAFWVVFEDIVLILSCLVAAEEMRAIARKGAELEAASQREQAKSTALNTALAELRVSQETLVRTEKMAAVGQLAASVGHELRNPLAALRNANAYIAKRVRADKGNGNGGNSDARVNSFLDIMDREFDVCNRIITDLLDFARERPPALQPVPLRPLVDEAIAMVPPSSSTIVNEIAPEMPIPDLDKDQFRQVLINLVQNAAEAMSEHGGGHIKVAASHLGGQRFRVTVADDGPGIPSERVDKIFEPLFTTKTKGTGLGLAIVATIIKRHNGTIRVDTSAGRGSTFIIEWERPSAVLAVVPALAPVASAAEGAI